MSKLRVITGNAFSVLASDVTNRGATFVVYALVSRYLTAFEFGQMSLALTLFYLFQVWAAAGLRTLITREVAKDRTTTGKYFVNGSIVIAVSSGLSVLGLALFVSLMNYAPDTASAILLLSYGLIPYSLSTVCEAVFQGREKMHYIAYTNVPVSMAKVGGAFFALSQGAKLPHLIGLILLSHVVIAVGECWIVRRWLHRPLEQIDLRFSIAMIRRAVTFLGIDGVIAISSSLNILLLSKLVNERGVGFYSAAAQLTIPITLIYQSTIMSIFPVLCRQFDASFQSLQRITERLLEILLIVGLPSAVGLFLLAEPVLLFLYGQEEFSLATGVLQITAWALVTTALTQGLGQVLLAGLKERITLRIVIVNAVLKLVLGLILIREFGLYGAAVAAVVTSIVNFFQHYFPVSKLLSGISVRRLAWKPIVATACMALYLMFMRNGFLFFDISLAAIVYFIALLLLAVQASGGLTRFKANYLYYS